MSVGSDGVLLSRPIRSRFIPFADIESATVEDVGKVVMRTRTHGTIIHRLRAAAAEAAVEQIQSSMASIGPHAEPVRQQLRREGPNVHAWLARLRTLAGRGSYRAVGLVGDALWRVMDDPGATGAERAAAAVIVGEAATPEERARLRGPPRASRRRRCGSRSSARRTRATRASWLSLSRRSTTSPARAPARTTAKRPSFPVRNGAALPLPEPRHWHLGKACLSPSRRLEPKGMPIRSRGLELSPERGRGVRYCTPRTGLRRFQRKKTMPNETSSKSSARPSIPTGPEEFLLLPLPDAALFPGTVVQIEPPKRGAGRGAGVEARSSRGRLHAERVAGRERRRRRRGRRSLRGRRHRRRHPCREAAGRRGRLAARRRPRRAPAHRARSARESDRAKSRRRRPRRGRNRRALSQSEAGRPSGDGPARSAGGDRRPGRRASTRRACSPTSSRRASRRPTAEKAELLATFDVKTRVLAVLTRVIRRGEVLKVKKSIDAQVQHDMGKKQREHILREQMKAIEKELGEGDDGDGDEELDALAKRVEEAKLPEEAREVADKQLKRLRSAPGGLPRVRDRAHVPRVDRRSPVDGRVGREPGHCQRSRRARRGPLRGSRR